MIEEISWILLGTLAGAITGMVPGIHANTIAFTVLLLPAESRIGMAMFIVAMSMSHSVFDAIPSVLLGAPWEESSVNLLPGHELLMRGKGLEAIQLSAFGAAMAAAFAIPLAPAFFSFAENYGGHLHIVIPALVAGTMLLMVLGEKNRAAAILVSLSAGAAGMFVLGSGIGEPVFALIIGFFGIPGLLQSLSSNAAMPAQEKRAAGRADVKIGFVAALTSGFLAAFPGIGPAQAAAIVKAFYRKLSQREYMALNGGINTANLLFSIIMLYALGKTRTGMAVALDSALEVGFGAMLMLFAAAIIAIGAAAGAIGAVASAAIGAVGSVDYRKVSAAAAVFLAALVLHFCGIGGLAACAGAAGISLFALASNVKRSQCMSFLLMPTLAFYAGTWI